MLPLVVVEPMAQSSEDVGKEEQDEEEDKAYESVGETAPANEEVDNSGVLGAEFRGGETIKEGSKIAEGEESESDPLSELRGGDTNKQAPLAISGIMSMLYGGQTIPQMETKKYCLEYLLMAVLLLVTKST